MSQQLGPVEERATSPHRYALTTKAGCECVVYALQGHHHFDRRSWSLQLDLAQSSVGRASSGEL